MILIMLLGVLKTGLYNLSFNLSQFNFTIENGYDRIRRIDMLSTTDTGAPELPVKSLNFIHPNGTRVKDIEILSLSLIPVEGTYNIYPAQPPIRLDGSGIPL